MHISVPYKAIAATAICSAWLASAPVSLAAIYTYTLNSPSSGELTMTIDTDNQSGTIVGDNNTSLSFSGPNLASFQGGASPPTESIALENVTGTLYYKGGRFSPATLYEAAQGGSFSLQVSSNPSNYGGDNINLSGPFEYNGQSKTLGAGGPVTGYTAPDGSSSTSSGSNTSGGNTEPGSTGNWNGSSGGFATVPEPAVPGLIGFGILTLAACRRLSRRKKAARKEQA